MLGRIPPRRNQFPLMHPSNPNLRQFAANRLRVRSLMCSNPTIRAWSAPRAVSSATLANRHPVSVVDSGS